MREDGLSASVKKRTIKYTLNMSRKSRAMETMDYTMVFMKQL